MARVTRTYKGVTATQRDDLDAAGLSGELWEDLELKQKHDGVLLTKVQVTWEHCEADHTLVVKFREGDEKYVEAVHQAIRRRLEASWHPFWKRWL